MKSQYFNMMKRKQVNGPAAAVLKFDKEVDEAPRVVAKGRGYVAEKIIETAREHGVYLQEDPVLLENLLDIDLGDCIPPQLYAVIAEILVFVWQIDKNY